MVHPRNVTRTEFAYLAGAITVRRGPSSVLWSSGVDWVVHRSKPELSAEAPPISEDGPRFFPVTVDTPGGTSDKLGGKWSTMKALACRSPTNGVPSAAVADYRCSQVVHRMVERAVCCLSSDEPWPPMAIAETEMRPRLGSWSYTLGRVATVRSRTDVSRSKDMSVTRYFVFLMELCEYRFTHHSRCGW